MRAPAAGWQGRIDMSIVRKTSGGVAYIRDSRIPVCAIVLLYESGADFEEILAAHPQLTIADCAAALDYASANRAEIDADIIWGYGSGDRDDAL
jgi:uncharacterized protein (DUF433 family)